MTGKVFLDVFVLFSVEPRFVMRILLQPVTTSSHLWSRATAGNISRVTVNRFPFDVIVFAMLPDHGIWRETVSFVRCYVTMSLPMNGCAVPGKTPAIDPRQKWLPLNYSFVRIQNSLTNLFRVNKFFTIFGSKTRLVRLIYIRTKE